MRLSRNWIGLVVFLFSTTASQAQSNMSAGFSLFLEQGFNTFNTTGMNSFVESFNSFWGSSLKTPFESYSGREFSHLNWGAGFRFVDKKKIGYTGHTAFLYGGGKDRNTATWSNDIKSELYFKVKDYQWTFSSGVSIQNFYVEGYFGAYIRVLRLNHFTEYADGSKSLSSEYKLNGLYTGTTSSVEYGGQVGYRLKSFLFYLRFTNPLKNFPPAKGLVTLDDYSNVNYPPSDFPANYTLYATDPIAFVEQNGGVKTDEFEGSRITLGMEIIFGAKKDE